MAAGAFMKALRGMPGQGSMPVIGLTSSDPALDAPQQEGAFTALFHKPVPFDRLLRQLHELKK